MSFAHLSTRSNGTRVTVRVGVGRAGGGGGTRTNFKNYIVYLIVWHNVIIGVKTFYLFFETMLCITCPEHHFVSLVTITLYFIIQNHES